MCAASDTSGELLFVSSSLLSVILLEVSMWLTPPRLLQDVAAALLVLDVTSATSLSPAFIIIINSYKHHSFALGNKSGLNGNVWIPCGWLIHRAHAGVLTMLV